MDENNQQRVQPKKLQIADLHEFITCNVCKGYIINATAIDTCFHTFCRSCIVKHLNNGSSYCPQCRSYGGYKITTSNLRPNESIQALIYKIVPDLYHSERKREHQFTVANGLKNGYSNFDMQDDFYFSPTETISSSLEYHSASLNSSNEDEIPPIIYLNCPAGVRIHSLKNLIRGKYNIVPGNKNVQVEIIYEDEVLPNHFTLMDVAYCYKWKASSGYKGLCKPSTSITIENCMEELKLLTGRGPVSLIWVPCHALIEKYVVDLTMPLVSLQLNVHAPLAFQYRIVMYENKPHSSAKRKLKKKCKSFNEKPAQSTSAYTAQSKLVSSSNDSVNRVSESAKVEHEAKSKISDFANQDKTSANDTAATKIQQTTTTKQDIAPMKVVIARKSTESKKQNSTSKRHNSNSHSNLSSTTNVNVSTNSNAHTAERSNYSQSGSGDFKSLRSNDIRFSDYTVTSTTNHAAKTATATATTTTATAATTNNKESVKAAGKCDVVVTIPHSQIPYTENELHEFALKTANKKSPPSATSSASTTSNTNNNNNNSNRSSGGANIGENGEKPRNVPKLKIELNALKMKKSKKPKSAEAYMGDEAHVKKLKYRQHSLDETGPVTDKVDLETYAKNIGLKPIEVLTTSSETEPKYSFNASPMSTSSCSTTSSSNGISYLNSIAEITSSSSSHKKRKKKKDSKSPSSKKKKLHAEVSSEPAEKSLKMKVKLTTPHNLQNNNNNNSNNNNNNNSGKKMQKIEASNRSFELFMAQVIDVDSGSLDEERGLKISPAEKGSGDLLKSPPATNKKSIESLNTCSGTNATEKSSLEKMQPEIKKTSKALISPPLPPSLFKMSPPAFPALTQQSETVQSNKKLKTPNELTTITKIPVPEMKVPFFVIPKPPPPVQKVYSAPPSIARAINKPPKRSASFDATYMPNTLAKQQKRDYNRSLTYDGTYGSQRPQLVQGPTATPKMGARRAIEIPIHEATMSSKYAVHDRGKRKLLPAASSMTANGVTTTTRPIAPMPPTGKLPIMSYKPRSLSKPALETVKMPGSQLPMDLLSLPPLSPPLNTQKPSMPKLPVPSFKNSKSAPTATLRSPSSICSSAMPKPKSPQSSFRNSPPALINFRNTVPLSYTTTTATTTLPKSKLASYSTSSLLETSFKKPDPPSPNKSNSSVEKTAANSLREFRLNSRDGMNITSILDLSGSTKEQDEGNRQEKGITSIPSGITNSLEAALSKIKRNFSTCTSKLTDLPTSNKLKKPESADADLQNLHLLSESATAREKLAIKSQHMTSTMRQQNASVRSIPNPSALAFRNQPMLTNLTTTTATTAIATTTTITTTVTTTKTAATTTSLTSSAKQSTTQNCTPMPILSLCTAASIPKAATTMTTASSSPPQQTTSITTTSPTRPVKKPTTIDQVAANLNIRAAAAEASNAAAAKAINAVEELSVVSSSSSSTTALDNEFDKQINSMQKTEAAKSIDDSAAVKEPKTMEITPSSSSGKT